MDSVFFYRLVLHRDGSEGQVEATWVSRLPLVQSVINQVVVLSGDDGTQAQGMYVYDGTRWRFVLPYNEVSYAIIIGATLDVFYAVDVPYTQLPTNASVWRNGLANSGTTIGAGDGAVWAARTPPTVSTGGTVISVNNVNPDTSGNVSIGISNIPGLQTALANAGSVKTVNGNSPDVNGNVTVPIPVISVSGQTGTVVVQAVPNPTGTNGLSPVLNSGATTGTIVLRQIVGGTGVTAALDGNGNIDLSVVPYTLPPATTSTLGGVIIQNGLTVDGAGNVSANVLSFNTRIGAITLQLSDVTNVGGAPLASPVFTGAPTAPTPTTGDNSTNIATTAFVTAAVAAGAVGAISTFEFIATANQTVFPATFPAGSVVEVFDNGALLLTTDYSTNGGVGPVTLNTGANVGDEIKIIATAPFTVANTVPITGGTYTGQVFGVTPAPGNNTTAFATTAFVTAAITAAAGVASFNTRTGAVTLQLSDVTSVGGAPLASPTFTGVPAAPTATAGTNTTQVATTAYVVTALGTYAPLASPALTGTPTAPTATAGTNTTQVATTAFVTAAVTAAAGVVSFNTRTGAVTLQLSDVTSVGGAPLASPTFTGTVAAPTPTAGDSTTKVATTAFVATSFAPLASPALTGTPTAPTATAGTNTTQIATTAFVTAAVAAGTAGVASFNTRTGAVTLQLSDVTSVGGAPLASPTFTGTPAAPTATAGTNTTQVATTAFVATSFAPLASPALTGTPTAPTATAGTNTTQLATTAYVVTALGSYAPLASPALTGIPTAPTATTGTNNTQLATTNYVYGATQGQTSVALTNANVTLTAAQYSNPAIKFTGTLTGNVTITFPAPGNWDIYNATTGAFTVTLSNGTGATVVIPQANTLGIMSDATAGILSASSAGGAVTSVATRTGAIVLAVADVSGAAPLASPTFTGTPVAPTATAGTNTTQIATTAFVATSFAPLASPALTGTPTAPTATAGTNTTQLATTAFVATSFAPLASPAFTGTPTLPTASAGTNSTQGASTAFVYNATQAIGTVALTNANVTLSATQYGNALINFTGTLTASVTITFPNAGQWTLFNNTTGAFTVTVSNGSGATFVIPQGATIEVMSNGSTGMLASSTASPVRFQSPAYSYTVFALGSVSGTQTLNLGTASEFTMTITGATTIAFTNTLGTAQAEVVYIRFTNAGSAAITWPASTKFAGGAAPTFTASGVDMVGVKYDTTTSTYMVFVVGLAIA